MRRIAPLAVASAFALALASQANASFTISTQQIAIDPTLTANGWIGLILTMNTVVGVGTSQSQTLTTIDLAQDPFSNGGTIGLQGTFHQDWQLTTSTQTTAAANPTPATTATGPFNDGTDQDSLFLNSNYFLSTLSPDTETNNMVHVVTNLPNNYTGSPLVNTPFINHNNPGNVYGVTTAPMTFAGAALATPGFQQVSEPFAFVIVPQGSPLIFRGNVYDNNNNHFFMNVTIPTAVPEPASLGVLALGGLSLLAKRRKRA